MEINNKLYIVTGLYDMFEGKYYRKKSKTMQILRERSLDAKCK